MSSNRLFTIFALITTAVFDIVAGGQSWDHLSSTYALIPIHGFNELPRTALEAFKKNWVKVGSCQDTNSPFLGERYIRSLRDQDIVLIFDVNGVIAGIQNVIPSNLPSNEFIDLNRNPFYQRSRLMNLTDAYFTTAYFIDPSRICREGRTLQEFQRDGTGYTLSFQRGPNPRDLMTVPLLERNASRVNNWYEHGCWFNMGKHYSPFNYKQSQECNGLFPGQIIYHNSQLHGFAWMHFGNLRSRRYEHPHSFILKRLFKKGPKCLYKAYKDYGVSSMHIYFKSHRIMCP